ncbi:DNA primase family protein [Larkinella humicola]|uniref:DNA primase n=1 Tax=Larkinella humicola TaxID=2607654 RepID=A0A5N1JCT6_9BACT|nr:DNA primase family protein [Larkinella humicola]KAA9349573.1 DNA primase [Larkinella humicola]
MEEESGKDTLTISDITTEIAADANRLKNAAFVFQPHQQLMINLLEQVEKVDFRAFAFSSGNENTSQDEDSKLRKEHYLVTIVEELLDLAQKNKWGLCQRNTLIYLYNGAFWKAIEKEDLKAFLQKVAEKMGADKFKARYYEFADQLFKQFEVSAHLPSPVADRNTVKINLINGTFEINTISQQLRPPASTDFLTHQLSFAYNPTATAPQFQKFLDRVVPDIECQKLLAEYLGYVFISPSKLKLEKTLLLYGSGANGKSVFFEIVTALLGQENVSHYSLQSLTNEPAYSRAHLATKLVNYASEINGKLEANTFKQMVSGEPVEARLPYGQPFIMTEYAKLIFNCNELPADVEHTPAYFRRFLIVPFTITIPEEEQDKQLSAKIIQSELSGVFNWVLDGLRRLLIQERFTDPIVVREQLEAYKRQSDTVRLFLDEQAYQPHIDAFISLQDLYRHYKEFCIEDGYRPVKKLNFRKRIESYGILTADRNIGKVVFVKKSY